MKTDVPSLLISIAFVNMMLILASLAIAVNFKTVSKQDKFFKIYWRICVLIESILYPALLYFGVLQT